MRLPTQAERGEAFRALHEGEPFVIPNPWDAGSARLFERRGFKALATTSSGLAGSLGGEDGDVTLDQICAHVAALCEATSLPVSADLENGYGAVPSAAAEAITQVAKAGAVGGSIEDWDRDDHVIYCLEHAEARVAAAAEAARALDFPFVLTARAENHIRENPDLDDTIERLKAYEAAGADVLYAPGVREPDDIRAICDAVSKPVNVLAFSGMSVAEIAGAGAQRISVGGGIYAIAMAAASHAARRIVEEGVF
jgi:2-methylisocitrate lyase-like PEP mutase family enzyme